MNATATATSYDVTIRNFEQDVIARSMTTPVLVDFWAPWCGPCQSLKPVLERVVASYAGRVVLAKVNTDEEPQLASAFGIRSLPTVMLLIGGQPVDSFMGAQPESQVRALIDRHLPAAEEPAETQVDLEDFEARISKAQEQVRAEPEKVEHRYALAQLLLRARMADEATRVLDAVASKYHEDIGYKRLRGQIALVESVATAPAAKVLEAALSSDADNHRARHQLATLRLVNGELEAALDGYLELLRRQRDFDDGLAKRSLIAAFDLIEDEDLVGRYRRKMASLLF